MSSCRLTVKVTVSVWIGVRIRVGVWMLIPQDGMGRMPILQTTGKTGMGNLRNRPHNRQLPDRISSLLIVI